MTTTLSHTLDPASCLRREDLSDNPIEQFRCWLDQAARGPVGQALAMSLATVDRVGQPLLRTVLLKAYNEAGFVFLTHVRTRKVDHIRDNPKVSLLFPWIAMNRQVIITGNAVRLSALEAAKYVLLADNRTASARVALEVQWTEMKRKLAEGSSPLAASWTGYRVAPDTIEFWQGRGRPNEHDRFLYLRSPGGEWNIEALE